MNPNTGEIRTFKTMEDAAAAGFTIPISEEEAAAAKQMSLEERVAWANDRAARMKTQAPRPVGLHPSGKNRKQRRAALHAAKKASP